jgi:hypothetical protein
MRQSQHLAVTRRHAITTLGTLIPIFALGACAIPVPAVLARPTPAPVTLPVVVAEAYSRDVMQGGSHTTVLDDSVRRWVAAAEAALHGRVTLPIQIVPFQSVGVDIYATTAAVNAGTTQPLWFATHDNLWRLRADGVLADLRAQVTKDHTLGNGRLHPDALSALHWAGAQVGLPVALWPALLAMDARVPSPPVGWSWADAARVPAGNGWPVQLMPDMPPLETWLWPHGADLFSADNVRATITDPAALTGLAAYANAFGPSGQGKLSPPPGGGLRPEDKGTPDSDTWIKRAPALRDQQVQQRLVQAWFPPDEWPPATPGPHRWQDGVGPLRRVPVPGAAQGALPVITYGVGIRSDATQPDLAYSAARALQEAAPAFLAYAPFVAEQTSEALQRRWSQLNAGQAAVLSAALRLRLRPVWSVPYGALLAQPFLGWSVDITQPQRWDGGHLMGAGIPRSPQALLHVTLSLCQVLALGLLPVPIAAANAAHAIQAILAAWAERPNG